MNYFLAKSEPQTYSIDDLEREGRTVSDGVRNPQALQAIRRMKKGDRVFIYHSGGHSAVAGLAEVAGEPRPDPSDSKLSVVDLRYMAHLTPPTTLSEIKASQLFDDWSLVRQSRLSTMEAPQKFADWMKKRYPDAGL